MFFAVRSIVVVSRGVGRSSHALPNVCFVLVSIPMTLPGGGRTDRTDSRGLVKRRRFSVVAVASDRRSISLKLVDVGRSAVPLPLRRCVDWFDFDGSGEESVEDRFARSQATEAGDDEVRDHDEGGKDGDAVANIESQFLVNCELALRTLLTQFGPREQRCRRVPQTT